MPVREKILEQLQLFGLTRLEAEAYATLVNLGGSVASELARRLNLRFPQLYDVMSSLERKGFVEVQDTRPKAYRAAEPHQLVTIKTEELVKSGEELLNALKDIRRTQKTQIAPRRPSVWITTGLKNIIRNINEVINSAKSDVLVICHAGLLDQIGKSLAVITRKNTQNYVITYPEGPREIAENLRKTVNVRVLRTSPFYSLAVADCERAVLSHRMRENEQSENIYGMVFEETVTPTLLGESFYSLWSKATPFEYGKKAVNYPKTFRTFRMAFVEIKELFGRAIIEVMIKGEDLTTGREYSAQGRVVQLEDTETVKNFTIKTNSGESVVIGGPYATAEDVEATQITIQAVHKKRASRPDYRRG